MSEPQRGDRYLAFISTIRRRLRLRALAAETGSSDAGEFLLADPLPETGQAGQAGKGRIATGWRKPERNRLPRFRASAIDRPVAAEGRRDLVQARLMLRDVFTPAQPVTERERFAGRSGVLARLIEIIEEQRSHVVIFGERGIGKTSLVHMLADLARESRYLVAYASCGAGARFDAIFRSVMADIPQLYLRNIAPTAVEAEGGATLADRLPAGAFDARELCELCAQITGTRVLVILDEYDRVEEPTFRREIAELVKNLSDRAARVQLILAGVGANIQELIGYNPSIRRNVVALPIPPFSLDEVRLMLAIGEQAAGIGTEEGVAERVWALSNGSPYLARLFVHHAGTVALDAGRLTIGRDDVEAALGQALQEAAARLTCQSRAVADQLLDSGNEAFVGAVARAAATPDGWFTLADVLVRLPAENVAEEVAAGIRHLARIPGLLEAEENVLQARFRFIDEALPTYLWMGVAGRGAVRRPAPAPRAEASDEQTQCVAS